MLTYFVRRSIATYSTVPLRTEALLATRNWTRKTKLKNAIIFFTDPVLRRDQDAAQGHHMQTSDSTIRSRPISYADGRCEITTSFVRTPRKKPAAHCGRSLREKRGVQPWCVGRFIFLFIRTLSIIGMARKVSSEPPWWCRRAPHGQKNHKNCAPSHDGMERNHLQEGQKRHGNFKRFSWSEQVSSNFLTLPLVIGSGNPNCARRAARNFTTQFRQRNSPHASTRGSALSAGNIHVPHLRHTSWMLGATPCFSQYSSLASRKPSRVETTTP